MGFTEIIDVKHSALLLVDLQRDFLAYDGVLAKAGQDVARMRQVIEPIKELLAFARPLGVPIIFIQFVDSYTLRNAAGKHMFEKKELSEDRLCCREGSRGAEFADIQPEKVDIIIVKHSYDAFDQTKLESLLRKLHIKALVIGGVKTNACVESTVRTAYHKGFYAVVPRECVAINTEGEHEASLFNIDRYFGDVVDLQKLSETWKIS